MSSIKWRWARFVARMSRDKAPPEFVARGWAIGMFFGCTIPFGFQVILSVPTALLLKGSRVGAVCGTLITNQLTIFFIYPAQCWAGNAVLSLFGCNVVSVENITAAFGRLGGVSPFSADFWAGLASLGGEMTASFFIGGALLALVCTPATYAGVLRFVRVRRAKREARRLLGRELRRAR